MNAISVRTTTLTFGKCPKVMRNFAAGWRGVAVILRNFAAGWRGVAVILRIFAAGWRKFNGGEGGRGDGNRPYPEGRSL